MSKSIDDLIRDLEGSGTLSGSRSPAPAPASPPTPTRGRVRGLTSSGTLFLIAAVLIVSIIGSLPLGSYALYPFSLFVTLVHETGHAVAALLTGGAVDNLTINGDLSGVTTFNPGIQGLIAPAGYLGATLVGVSVLLTPLRFARWVVGALAAIPVAALLFFHPGSWFTAGWCVVFALALGVAAWKLPARWLGFLQIFLGVEIGLNAFRDLSTLVLISSSGAHIQNDAEAMSRALFLPAIFWATAWTAISVVALIAALVILVKRDLPSLRRKPTGV